MGYEFGLGWGEVESVQYLLDGVNNEGSLFFRQPDTAFFHACFDGHVRPLRELLFGFAEFHPPNVRGGFLSFQVGFHALFGAGFLFGETPSEFRLREGFHFGSQPFDFSCFLVDEVEEVFDGVPVDSVWVDTSEDFHYL